MVLVLRGRSRENKAQWRFVRRSQFRLIRRGRIDRAVVVVVVVVVAAAVVATERACVKVVSRYGYSAKASEIKLQVPHANMQEARFNS